MVSFEDLVLVHSTILELNSLKSSNSTILLSIFISMLVFRIEKLFKL